MLKKLLLGVCLAFLFSQTMTYGFMCAPYINVHIYRYTLEWPKYIHTIHSGLLVLLGILLIILASISLAKIYKKKLIGNNVISIGVLLLVSIGLFSGGNTFSQTWNSSRSTCDPIEIENVVNKTVQLTGIDYISSGYFITIGILLIINILLLLLAFDRSAKRKIRYHWGSVILLGSTLISLLLNSTDPNQFTSGVFLIDGINHLVFGEYFQYLQSQHDEVKIMLTSPGSSFFQLSKSNILRILGTYIACFIMLKAKEKRT